jgi:cytoskeletal protein CcmA (bactofilin family)
VSAAVAFAPWFPASAVQFIATTNYMLAAEQRTDTEVWIMARQIAIRGTAADDLFLLAGSMEGGGAPLQLPGRMSNDVWAIGGHIKLDGAVGDHARLLGFHTVAITGSVGRGLTAVGNTVHLGSGGKIGGAALLIGENVMVEGEIAGDTVARARRLTLAGRFGGDVRLAALERIVITPGTTIEGDLHYLAPAELVLDPQVIVKGRCIRDKTAATAATGTSLADVLLDLAFFFGAVLAGILLLAAFPHFTAHSVRLVEQSRWKCLLAGLIAFCLAPMTALFAAVTIVGLPAALLLIGLYLLLIFTSKFVVALMLGRLLFSRRPAVTSPLLMLGCVSGK